MKKENTKKVLSALLLVSIGFFSFSYLENYKFTKSIEDMYLDIYDIMANDKRGNTTFLRSANIDPTCKQMSITYLEKFYKELYTNIKLGSMQDIFEIINNDKNHIDSSLTGETMVNFGCSSGGVIWLSTRKRNTITKIENRLNIWIANHQEEE